MANSKVAEVFTQVSGKELSRKTLAGIIAGVYIIAAICFFAFFYVPKANDVADLENEVSRNELTIKQLGKYRDTIPSLELQLSDTERMLKQAAAATPRDQDMALVMDVLAEFAKANHLTLQAMDHTQVDWNWANSKQLGSQLKGANAEDIGQVEVSTLVEGPYNNLVTFVSSLEHTFGNARFDDIQVEVDTKSDNGRIKAKLAWSLWVLKSGGLRFPGEWNHMKTASTYVPTWRNPFIAYKLPVSVEAVKEVFSTEGKPIKLTGVARTGRTWRGVLIVGDRSYMVKPGDQVEGMRVVDINTEGVSMWIKDEPRFIKLGEGGKK